MAFLVKFRRLRRQSRKLQSIVAYDAGYLRDSDATLAGQLLFRLLAGVRVGEVRVEVLVQNLGGLLAEVAAFSARIQKTASGHSFNFSVRQKLSWLSNDEFVQINIQPYSII